MAISTTETSSNVETPFLLAIAAAYLTFKDGRFSNAPTGKKVAMIANLLSFLTVTHINGDKLGISAIVGGSGSTSENQMSPLLILGAGYLIISNSKGDAADGSGSNLLSPENVEVAVAVLTALAAREANGNKFYLGSLFATN